MPDINTTKSITNIDNNIRVGADSEIVTNSSGKLE